MRKLLAVAVLILSLGLMVPAAWAQAPAPKVSIVGLFDQVTSMNRNVGENNYSRTSDRDWVARTRFRPDFQFAVGRTKAVLGLEIDVCYGQAGQGDGSWGGQSQGVVAANTSHNGNAFCAGSGDINTDIAGIIEIKWMYTEFDLTGKDSLMPFIPVGTVARAGLQPFASLGNYKVVYANGDFAGLSMVSTFAPNLKTNVTFVQVEEAAQTNNRGGTAATGLTNPQGKLTRGDDFALIFSVDWTLMKGLDFKPMYSFFFGQGLTSTSSRRSAVNVMTSSGTAVAGTQGTTGLQGGAGNIAAAPALGSGNPAGNTDFHENRHTIGFDARWRYGAFSLDPTLLYQWGSFDTMTKNNTNGRIEKINGDINAWLLDIQAGYQMGPLLLEARYIYSTGNKARDNIARNQRYFTPLDMDSSYYAGWASIIALGVDYFQGGSASGMGLSQFVGYDRYGRNSFGVRGTYALTPALSFYTVVSPTWSAQEVDTKTGVAGSSRTYVSDRSFTNGNSAYIGTDWTVGMTWRFAPNAAFDLSGAMLFTGDALDTTECGLVNAVVAAQAGSCPIAQTVHRRSQDAYTAAARVRLSF
ncbi:MAG: hypothetical protein ACRELS_04530 [Candidatus Rokuibacteriota bacterium]